MEKQIQNCIATLFQIENIEVSFSVPPKKEFGDLSFTCFSLAKILKKAPFEIAKELSEYINSHLSDFSGISKVVQEGGYLNIFLQNEKVGEDFKIFSQGELYPKIGTEKTIVIDYIGANVGKPLHIGHMCTPNQGQVFINLFKKLGYTVISDSHLGDWGIIFGKLMVAYHAYGDAQKLKANAVNHLFELYVTISDLAEKNPELEQQFRDVFKLLSSGDTASVQMWKEFTQYSINAMNELLARLYVHPDYNIGESFYEGIGLPKIEDVPDLQDSMYDVVLELLSKGIATKNEDNSVGVIFPDDEKIPSCILQKRDGTHGYLASDLACIKYRMQNWNPEKILYFVDVRQQLHLKQVFYIAKAAGWLDEKTQLFHAYNGFISLKDGAMSTRKGKIIKLGDLLDEGVLRSKAILSEKRSDLDAADMQRLSEIISIGAIKYGYLKKNRTSDVVFDWDEFMTFDGNSGPYIAYGYVRALKILEKNDFIFPETFLFEHESEKQFALELMKFSEVILSCSQHYMAHILCQYAYDLTKLFSNFYSQVSIQQIENPERKNSLLGLCFMYEKIIREIFEVLAIPLPEKM